MLELRPNCECCGKGLPPDSPDARICSFECTFCKDCVEGKLGNKCPNCGGEFVRRPVRPAHLLENSPASRKIVAKLGGCAPMFSAASKPARRAR